MGRARKPPLPNSSPTAWAWISRTSASSTADTDAVQYGIGTFGSRATAVGGTAMVHAMGKIKDKVIKIAAHLMESNPQDIVLEDGKYSVHGAPESGLSLAEIAQVAHVGVGLPPETEPGLAESALF